MPAAKRKKARCGKNRLHNAPRTSRPASLLSSQTDYDRRSITAASTTDFDGFSSWATALRGRPSCPLRSEKRRGAKKTGSTMLHGLRPSLLSSPTDYDRRSITAASTTDFDGFSSWATGPNVLPAAKRKRARCGKNRLHIESTMLHGLQGLLLYSAHRRTTIDARSLLHR